jgi:outer membrane protein assembly factor BamB
MSWPATIRRDILSSKARCQNALARFAAWCVMAAAAVPAAALEPDDWPQFRGPHGAAHAAARDLPDTWDAQQNIRWKTPLPGPGGSSPIVVGERVFITSYSGYGVSAEQPGDKANLVRHLLCLDRADGTTLWQHNLAADSRVINYADFIQRHGYATSTPASDGTRLYAFLENSGVHAFDLDGRPLWRAEVGEEVHNWGSAASLSVDDRLVYVNASVESDSLIALDKESGHEVWRTKRVIGSWSTPALVETADGRRELVLNVKGRLVGIDPQTGEERWRFQTKQSVGAASPVIEGGRIYFAGANPKFVCALRPGGQGEVTESALIWKTGGVGANISSAVVAGGRVFVIDGGIAACLDASDGRLLAKRRLHPSGATFYASPVVAGKKLIAVSRDQGAYVLSADEQLTQLAVNRLGDDMSIANATPAIHRGELLLRTDRAIYCIGSAPASAGDQAE